MRWRNQLIKSKSEWNYVRIPKTKGPKPTLPITRLFRPWINRLTKLVSLKWISFFLSLLVNVHDLSFFFAIFHWNKRWKIVCLFSIYWKNGKIVRNTCHFFSFFLLKWNYGKLGDRYAIFLFVHFLNKMEKMKKWCE